MSENINDKVRQAIDRSMKWAEDGWPVTFGSRKIVVSSLQQAYMLPPNVVYREDALNYWNLVARVGTETAEYGRTALAHLADNNIKAAEDTLYFACYLENPLVDYTMTWKPVHQMIKKELLHQANQRGQK